MAQKVRVVFTPVKDFASEEFRSTYHKGLSYQVKETYTDEQYARLLTAVRRWEKDGLVLVGEAAIAALGAQHGVAAVKGGGTVK